MIVFLLLEQVLIIEYYLPHVLPNKIIRKLPHIYGQVTIARLVAYPRRQRNAQVGMYMYFDKYVFLLGSFVLCIALIIRGLLIYRSYCPAGAGVASMCTAGTYCRFYLTNSGRTFHQIFTKYSSFCLYMNKQWSHQMW